MLIRIIPILIFDTLPFLLLILCNCHKTVTDIDGNVYHTIKIGHQIWTAENLRTTRYNDATVIPLITDSATWAYCKTPGFCYYENTTDVDSIRKYGALYNWYAVNTRTIAPKGWHVPTDADWRILEKYLIAHGYNWDRTRTGNKIAKSLSSKTGWINYLEKERIDFKSKRPWKKHYLKYADTGTPGNDTYTNNKSGFSALPAGGRHCSGSFGAKGYFAELWSVSEDDASDICPPHLYYNSVGLRIDQSYQLNKSDGKSVRIVKDDLVMW